MDPLPAAAAVTSVAVAALLVAEKRDHQRLRFVAKPVASLTFVGLAVALGAASTPYGRAVLAAFVLSLVGDVLLIPRSAGAFKLGVAAFGLAHVAFVVAFAVRGVAAGPAAAALVVLVPVALAARRWLRPGVPADLHAAVDAYMAVISLMLAAAIGTAAPSIVAGAAAFYLSDLSVARDRFVRPAFVNRLWGLPLYFAAQLVLAATVR